MAAVMMFICLFNPARLNVARAVRCIQLSPVAASLCFLSTDGVVSSSLILFYQLVGDWRMRGLRHIVL
jgi:hypothetical protein